MWLPLIAAFHRLFVALFCLSACSSSQNPAPHIDLSFYNFPQTSNLLAVIARPSSNKRLHSFAHYCCLLALAFPRITPRISDVLYIFRKRPLTYQTWRIAIF
ncbi:hypothetical protein BDZ97DRAFT_1790538 [Flammula alnicola]|nr:hypothetical protein BDZ97DRAFT_1790538 [Flammula alnicola]